MIQMLLPFFGLSVLSLLNGSPECDKVRMSIFIVCDHTKNRNIHFHRL